MIHRHPWQQRAACMISLMPSPACLPLLVKRCGFALLFFPSCSSLGGYHATMLSASIESFLHDKFTMPPRRLAHTGSSHG